MQLCSLCILRRLLSLVHLNSQVILLFLELLHLNLERFIRILQYLYLLLQLSDLTRVILLIAFDLTLQGPNNCFVLVNLLLHLFSYFLILCFKIVIEPFNFSIHLLVIPANFFDNLGFGIDFNAGYLLTDELR